MSRWRRLLALSAILALAACSKERSQSAPQSPAASIERVIEKGPVEIRLQAQSGEVDVGQRLAITVHAFAENGVELRMPQLGTTLGPFEVSDRQSPPDIPEDGRRRWTLRFMIRTLEAGEHDVPPLTIAFRDLRIHEGQTTSQRAVESQIQTPALPIVVRSVLAADVDPSAFRDIKQAADISVPWRVQTWQIASVIAAAAMASLLAWAIMRRTAGRQQPAPEDPPHVWALKQLDALEMQQLLERNQFHAFFYQLSAIVRQYIERRFAIMAAEQTTEEFLAKARRSASLQQEHRELLATFLRLADMVKFARFQPPQIEAQSALATARDFVCQTVPGSPEPADGRNASNPVAEAAA